MADYEQAYKELKKTTDALLEDMIKTRDKVSELAAQAEAENEDQ